jgi:FKBP12-rapamycin complex-associated protein
MILWYFKSATRYAENWYKAWHSWALANFDVVSHYQKLKAEAKGLPSCCDIFVHMTVHNINIGKGKGKSRAEHLEKKVKTTLSNIDALNVKIENHIVPAVHGFFRSIALAPSPGMYCCLSEVRKHIERMDYKLGKNLQDTLRLLTLLFKYGEKKNIAEALLEVGCQLHDHYLYK